MKDLTDIKVSHFDKYNSVTPSKDVTLFEALLCRDYKETVEAIRREPDEAKQKEMKMQLPLFTPGGTFKAPGTKGLVTPSHFLQIDIDKQDNPNLPDFGAFKALLQGVRHIAYCGRSARGNGVFCIVPVRTPEMHKEYYKCFDRQFSRCGIKIDPSVTNIAFKRFYSFEDKPYINMNAETWDYILPEGKETLTEHFGHTPTDEEIRAEYLNIARDIERDGIDITTDTDEGDDYARWFKILSAIATDLGEEGREYAHTLSRFYPGYDPEETDTKFDSALKFRYDVHLGTVIMYYRETLSKHRQMTDFEDINI